MVAGLPAMQEEVQGSPHTRRVAPKRTTHQRAALRRVCLQDRVRSRTAVSTSELAGCGMDRAAAATLAAIPSASATISATCSTSFSVTRGDSLRRRSGREDKGSLTLPDGPGITSLALLRPVTGRPPWPQLEEAPSPDSASPELASSPEAPTGAARAAPHDDSADPARTP